MGRGRSATWLRLARSRQVAMTSSAPAETSCPDTTDHTPGGPARSPSSRPVALRHPAALLKCSVQRWLPGAAQPTHVYEVGDAGVPREQPAQQRLVAVLQHQPHLGRFPRPPQR
eukprot:scaffold5213_cov113-Isochrysis_galbana.AAC.8